MDIAAEKAKARDYARQRIKEMAPHQRDAESRSICRRIKENLPPHPVTICVYSAIPAEASLDMLMPELLRRGDRVYLPRFSNNELHFGLLTEETELVRGELKILEPPMGAEEPDLSAIDIVLTPGLAFDREKHRLGRGNGGYDRWLEKLRKANNHVQIWGVALDCQMLREVPVEAHDRTVDAVVTPREMIA